MQTQATTAVVSNFVMSFAQPSAKKVKRGVPEVYQLHRVNLRTMIEIQGSKMVSVDYEKLNGMARTLTGCIGVKTHLKGGRNLVEKDDRSYLTIFDMQLKSYRTVNLATVTELRCNRKIFRVID